MDALTAGISIDREVERLVKPRDDHVALVAEHDGLAVGVASYEILSSAQAEIAVLVSQPILTNERSPRQAYATAPPNTIHCGAPASVAVIGVSQSQSGVGYEILQAVLAGGFTRHTYPVNPHRQDH